MNCLLIIIPILVLISESSAANKTVTELKNPKEIKSFAEQFATLLGTFSFAAVVTVISPVILKIGLVPLFFIAKIISKPLVMIGITGWLMVALTPLILARSGLTSPVFESRSQDDQMFSSIARLLSTNMSVITSETMNFFDLNNDECKLEMSCRLGKKIANIVPYLTYFAKQSGAANWMEEKYMANMVRSMTDPKDCTNSCISLNGDMEVPTSYSTDSSDSKNNVFDWLG